MALMDYTSLFLAVVIQFAAVTECFNFFLVKLGDDITLPCQNVDQAKCDNTTWINKLRDTSVAVHLFKFEQITEEAKSRSDRLTVTEKCSLVIKKVTDEDVGLYGCLPHKSMVDLSVVKMTEQQFGDKVTLNFSVLTPKNCKYTMQWVYEGKYVDKNHTDLITSQSECWTSVTFLKSHFIYDLLKCNVTCIYTGTVQQFTFTPQSSGYWWLYITVAVGLVTILIIVLAVIIWKRTNGNKSQMDHNTDDPEDGVSYATLSFVQNTNSNVRIQGSDDDSNNETVTYSSIRTFSPSARGF